MNRRTVVVSRRSHAPIEAVWALLGHADSWREWAAFTKSELEREGAPDRDGVGAIRRFGFPVYTSREEVVAFEPPTHLAYILHGGLPLDGYRSDVTLTPDGSGTDIEWRSSFDGRVADGWFWHAFLKLMLTDFARRLARTAERRHHDA
jgi:uncharacterized protein YndB with AHSA1/START domain